MPRDTTAQLEDFTVVQAQRTSPPKKVIPTVQEVVQEQRASFESDKDPAPQPPVQKKEAKFEKLKEMIKSHISAAVRSQDSAAEKEERRIEMENYMKAEYEAQLRKTKEDKKALEKPTKRSRAPTVKDAKGKPYGFRMGEKWTGNLPADMDTELTRIFNE